MTTQVKAMDALASIQRARIIGKLMPLLPRAVHHPKLRERITEMVTPYLDGGALEASLKSLLQEHGLTIKTVMVKGWQGRMGVKKVTRYTKRRTSKEIEYETRSRFRGMQADQRYLMHGGDWSQHLTDLCLEDAESIGWWTDQLLEAKAKRDAPKTKRPSLFADLPPAQDSAQDVSQETIAKADAIFARLAQGQEK